MAVHFKASKTDKGHVMRILDRMETGVEVDRETRINCEMDLLATHANGCPMDFAKLRAAPDFDFWHDLNGIRRHIDRATGKLGGCFLPRCAARVVTT